jgi:hypothetical protein
MTGNHTNSIAVLAVITLVLAIYTFFGVSWSRRNYLRWWEWAGKDRFRVFLALLFSVVLWAALLVGPGLVLGYLMNSVKLVDGIGPNGRFIVFLGWILPAFIYLVVDIARKSKSRS